MTLEEFVGAPVQPEAPQVGAFEAGLRGVKQAVLPSLAAAAPFVLLPGAQIPTALRFLGSLGAGFGAGYLQNKLQQRFLPEQFARDVAAEQQHPIPSFLGTAAGAATAFRFDPTATVKLAKTAFSSTAAPVERGVARAALGANVAVSTALGVVPPLLQGQPVDAKSVAEMVGLNLLLGGPRGMRKPPVVGGAPAAPVPGDPRFIGPPHLLQPGDPGFIGPPMPPPAFPAEPPGRWWPKAPPPTAEPGAGQPQPISPIVPEPLPSGTRFDVAPQRPLGPEPTREGPPPYPFFAPPETPPPVGGLPPAAPIPMPKELTPAERSQLGLVLEPPPQPPAPPPLPKPELTQEERAKLGLVVEPPPVVAPPPAKKVEAAPAPMVPEGERVVGTSRLTKIEIDKLGAERRAKGAATMQAIPGMQSIIETTVGGKTASALREKNLAQFFGWFSQHNAKWDAPEARAGFASYIRAIKQAIKGSRNESEEAALLAQIRQYNAFRKQHGLEPIPETAEGVLSATDFYGRPNTLLQGVENLITNATEAVMETPLYKALRGITKGENIRSFSMAEMGERPQFSFAEFVNIGRQFKQFATESWTAYKNYALTLARSLGSFRSATLEKAPLSAFSFEDGKIILKVKESGKGAGADKPRVVEVPPEVYRVLQKYVTGNPEFRGKDPSKVFPFKGDPAHNWERLEGLAKRYGPGGLRGSVSQILVEEFGYNPKAIAELQSDVLRTVEGAPGYTSRPQAEAADKMLAKLSQAIGGLEIPEASLPTKIRGSGMLEGKMTPEQLAAHQASLAKGRATRAANLAAAKQRKGEAGGTILLTEIPHAMVNAARAVYRAGMSFAHWATELIRRVGESARQWLRPLWSRLMGVKEPASTEGVVKPFGPPNGTIGAGIQAAMERRQAEPRGSIGPQKQPTQADIDAASVAKGRGEKFDADVRRLAGEGLTAAEIAKQLKTKTKVVREARSRLGIPGRYTGGTFPETAEKFTTWRKEAGFTGPLPGPQPVKKSMKSKAMDWTPAKLDRVNRLADLGGGEQQVGLTTDVNGIRKAILVDPTKDQVKKIESRRVSQVLPEERTTWTTAWNHVQKYWASLVNAARKIDLAIMPSDAFFDWLGGGKGTMNGQLSNYIKKPADHLYNAEINIFNKWSKDLLDHLNKNPIEKSRGVVMGVVMASERKGGWNRLKFTLNMDDAQVRAQVEKYRNMLTPQEKEFMQLARKLFDSTRDPIDQVLLPMGRKLKREESYFPWQRDNRLYKGQPEKLAEYSLSQAPGQDFLSQRIWEDFGIMTEGVGTEKGFTIPVKSSGNYPIKLNLLEIVDKYARDASHFVAFEEWLHTIAKVVRDKEFANRYGDIGQKMTMRFLNTVATQSRNADRNYFLDFFRKNTSVGVIGYRLSSNLVHLSNIPLAIYRLEVLNPGHGIAHYYGGLREIMRPEVQTWARKNMAETFKRGAGEPSVAELDEMRSKWGRFSRAGFAGARTIDKYNAQAVTIALYKALLAKKGKNADMWLDSPVDRNALAQAQMEARRAVASPIYKDVPSVLTKGSVARTLFQFQNVFLDQVSNARLEFLAYGKRATKGELYPIAAALTCAAATIALESGIKKGAQWLWQGATGYTPQIDKTKAEQYEEKMWEESLRRMPGMGQMEQLFSTIRRATKGEQVDIRTGIPSIDVGISVGQKGYEAYTATRDKERGAPIATAQLAAGIAELVGVPGASQLTEVGTMAMRADLQRASWREEKERGEQMFGPGRLTLQQRMQVGKVIKGEEPPKGLEAKEREQIRGARAQFRRQKQLTEALPKSDQSWLEKHDLTVAGYKATLTKGGGRLTLSIEEQEMYRQFVLEETQAAIERERQRGVIDAASSDSLKQKRWKVAEALAHQRAQRRLEQALSNPTIGTNRYSAFSE